MNIKQAIQNIPLAIDISHRGGTVGAASHVVVDHLFADKSADVQAALMDMLPNNVGAYCNYLGGGLRGAITASNYSTRMPAYAAKRIDAFTAECKAEYKRIEDKAGLNDEEDEDGETNWEAWGTNKARAAEIASAY